MKCIRNTETGKVEKVSDGSADLKVRTGEWEYVPKQVWKTEVRDVQPVKPKHKDSRKIRKRNHYRSKQKTKATE